MKIYLTFAAILALPTLAIANSDMITVEPGAWQSRSVVMLSGQKIADDTSMDCITPEDASRSLESMITQVEDEGNCTATNVQHSEGLITADLTCDIKEIGSEAAGQIEMRYTRTTYTLKATGDVNLFGGLLPISATSTGTRIGVCVKGD